MPRPVQSNELRILSAARQNAILPPSPPEEVYESTKPPTFEVDGLVTDESIQRPLVSRQLRTAIHVLNTEALALRCVTELYETDGVAQDGLNRAVELLLRQHRRGAKLVVTGVGKSGHIANKLTATFNSLSIPAVFLNPVEALHGDLGVLGPHDSLLFITFSGKTTELLDLLPHVSSSTALIVLTGRTESSACELVRVRPDAVLLPSPIPEPEASSFGVSAPTTSTTVALAVGDALAIAAAHELHASVAQVFSRNHPGGAIGASLSRDSERVLDMAHLWTEIPMAPGFECLGADLLRSAFDSPSKWVRFGDSVASPSRIRRLCAAEPGNMGRRTMDIEGLLVSRSEMIPVPAEVSSRRALELVANARGLAPYGDVREASGPGAVIAVLSGNELVGVIELEQLLKEVDGRTEQGQGSGIW